MTFREDVFSFLSFSFLFFLLLYWFSFIHEKREYGDKTHKHAHTHTTLATNTTRATGVRRTAACTCPAEDRSKNENVPRRGGALCKINLERERPRDSSNNERIIVAARVRGEGGCCCCCCCSCGTQMHLQYEIWIRTPSKVHYVRCTGCLRDTAGEHSPRIISGPRRYPRFRTARFRTTAENGFLGRLSILLFFFSLKTMYDTLL